MSHTLFHPFKGRVSKHFGENLAPADAYLSYYDVRLTKEDVDCIKDDWLTDNAIAFWEEYLEHEKLKSYPHAHINLLRPSMSQMLILTSDPLTLKDALPSFTHSTHIFVPINDNRDPAHAEVGSHWTLLLISTIDGVAFHYDSMRPANRLNATAATEKLAILLGRPLRFVDLDDSPQQENGSDCGVFVCLEMKFLLLHRLLQRDSREKVSMSMGGMEMDAVRGRKEMGKLIEEFRREGRRSRSRSRSPLGRHLKHNGSPPRVGD